MEGLIRLLFRPKSMLLSVLVGSALYFSVPGIGLFIPLAAGLATNFVESVFIRMKNQSKYLFIRAFSASSAF